MTDRISPPPARPCWLCADQRGIAVHMAWSAKRGKTLWTAHQPTSTKHPVHPCPACTPCLACSIDAGDRCLVSADEWPPLVLRGAQPTDDAATRASEPVRADGGPTPDAGDARGGEGGSAAESEPRDTVGPGYDAVWTYIRTHPGDAYRNAAIWRAVEAFRDAVIPAIRAQVADGIEAATEARVRAQIAAQIEAVFVLARRDQSPAEAKADAYRTAAAIARGDQ